jgi:hypothetical protein
VYLVGCTIGIYYDARTYVCERHLSFTCSENYYSGLLRLFYSFLSIVSTVTPINVFLIGHTFFMSDAEK